MVNQKPKTFLSLRCVLPFFRFRSYMIGCAAKPLQPSLGLPAQTVYMPRAAIGSLAEELTFFGCAPAPSVCREHLPCAFLILWLPFSVQQHPALDCERILEGGMCLCTMSLHTPCPPLVCLTPQRGWSTCWFHPLHPSRGGIYKTCFSPSHWHRGCEK